ncbi:hypothetical protein NDU88_003538 [Pleurodeles waltl]|uniref:Uncharacterized protein n=1 Tax=Pleurodeles waltl TaxID=8319 RepID=A0AAV7WPC4_PLEWA|nr:hypothetical protein NDU88_003538 [Pleurodeles waltl]
MTDKASDDTMERVLNEITAISRRLEGMDSKISALTAKTKSICLDIAGFQNRVVSLKTHMTSTEDFLNKLSDRDQELLYLHSNAIDLEDQNRRDNICLFHFPERLEGSDMKWFPKVTLPTPTGFTFDPPLELQRVHHIGSASHNLAA